MSKIEHEGQTYTETGFFTPGHASVWQREDGVYGWFKLRNFSGQDFISLRQNSVVYPRAIKVSEIPTAGEREKNLEWALRQIVQDLPQKRDWLDPDVEKVARALVGL